MLENHPFIPFVDLKIQYFQLKNEIDAAIAEVIENSQFILGPQVEYFEQKFAEYIGTKYAVGTSSGTSALQVSLLALGVGSGDEVIVPAMTFQATAEVVVQAGAKPVFVDVDPVTYTMDVNQVENLITPKTRVILPVHLYGHPAEADALCEIAAKNGIAVVEDCAHSHGAEYKSRKTGALGDIAAFSFYPGKNLGAFGEAGIVTTDDPVLYDKCLHLRNHGARQKFDHRYIGLNARMQGIQAAVLKVKLSKLEEWNSARREIAAVYIKMLAGQNLTLPVEKSYVKHVYHVYAVLLKNRDQIFRKMLDHKIMVNLHYPSPLHLLPSFSGFGYKKGDFPFSEKIALEELSLPCYPGMAVSSAEYLAETLLEICNN